MMRGRSGPGEGPPWITLWKTWPNAERGLGPASTCFKLFQPAADPWWPGQRPVEGRPARPGVLNLYKHVAQLINKQRVHVPSTAHAQFQWYQAVACQKFFRGAQVEQALRITTCSFSIRPWSKRCNITALDVNCCKAPCIQFVWFGGFLGKSVKSMSRVTPTYGQFYLCAKTYAFELNCKCRSCFYQRRKAQCRSEQDTADAGSCWISVIRNRSHTLPRGRNTKHCVQFMLRQTKRF